MLSSIKILGVKGNNLKLIPLDKIKNDIAGFVALKFLFPKI